MTGRVAASKAPAYRGSARPNRGSKGSRPMGGRARVPPMELLATLWDDYAALNPQAHQIHRLLEERGETVVNDHIALRTFGRAAVGIDAVAAPFVAAGYRPADTYDFPVKKLRARHYEPADASLPLVFISELRVDELPADAVAIVDRLVAQVPPETVARPDFPAAGRPWSVSLAEYDALAAHSEYAAWMAAFGYRANHFTVSVNRLQSFDDLAALNEFLVSRGFALNESGGVIKGGPEVLLAQSSTLASDVDVEFSDGARRVPGCYYEFARRYQDADGALYRGFVAQSADKIFESTDRRARE